MLRAKFKTWVGSGTGPNGMGWGWVPCLVLGFRTSPHKASLQVIIALEPNDKEGGLQIAEADMDSVRLLRAEIPLL